MRERNEKRDPVFVAAHSPDGDIESEKLSRDLTCVPTRDPDAPAADGEAENAAQHGSGGNPTESILPSAQTQESPS